MNNNLKTKDFIFIGIMSVVGMALYSIVMLITMPFGTFGHSISPGAWRSGGPTSTRSCAARRWRGSCTCPAGRGARFRCSATTWRAGS